MDSTLTFRSTALIPGLARPGLARPGLVSAVLFVWTLVVTSVLNPALAQTGSFNLDEITLPTDLIASVVRTEDDIRVANLLQANGGSEGGSVYGDVDTPVANSTPSGDSIFGNLDSASMETVSTVTHEPALTVSSAGDAAAESGVDVAVETEQTEVAESLESTEPTEPTDPTVVAASPTAEIAALPPTTLPSDPVTSGGNPETPEPEKTKALVAVEQKQDASLPTPMATEQETSEENIEVATIAPAAVQQEVAIDEDQIILGWATAWSNNDVEAYLDYYADDFLPADGRDREEWEANRRKRLKNQDIRIIVSNAEVHSIDGNRAEVRFTQRYTSKSYKDRVIKAITMEKTPEGWKFLSEKSLEKLPFK